MANELFNILFFGLSFNNVIGSTTGLVLDISQCPHV